MTTPKTIIANILNQKKHIQPHWRDIIQHHIPPISIALPIIIYLLPEKSINHNLLLRFITVILPCSYSTTQSLLLFLHNRKSCNYRSSYISSIRTSGILDVFLLSFISIPVILVFAASIDTWDDQALPRLSMYFCPLIVLSTYLLSTSCNLTTTSLQFTTTGNIDILLDLLMLL